MGYPAIAVSFDIPSKSFSPSGEQCEGATDAAIGVIEDLWAKWGTSTAEVYNVNVPLEATRATPVRRTHIDRDYCGAMFELSFDNTASVPFMITKAMKAELATLGHSEAEIKAMTPQEAHDLLHVKSGPPEPVWYAWSGPKKSKEFDEGSDAWTLAHGEVSVSALAAVHHCVADGGAARAARAVAGQGVA